MKVNHRASQEVHDLYDRIQDLEDKIAKLRAVLEDGCDLGLAPDECREVLARVGPVPDPA